MGNQPCYIDSDRLQEGFEVWRSVKIRELQRLTRSELAVTSYGLACNYDKRCKGH